MSAIDIAPLIVFRNTQLKEDVCARNSSKDYHAMKTMKALVKKEAKEGLWLDEVLIPEIDNNDVLVKIQKTAICGTDVHIYNWDEWSQKTI
ncbi:MAG: alcohol dehydrogenase catalytic domain-containing protein, partial [Gammaproteobacteria bacterium]|nr:alcohol dehydrogenase catalytic domain-containing protein [Gammaproteobacteria bacterium]